MDYSVVIPMHNEEDNAEKLVTQINEVLEKLGGESEIIAVNDNSTDETGKVLDNLRKKIPRLTPIHRRENRGVGNTIRKGLSEAKGEVIITLDGDLSHNPKSIPEFVEALDSSDMICGSRYVSGGAAEMNASRTIISRTFNTLFGLLLGLRISDFTSGYRAYKRRVIESISLESGEFGIYIEIPIKVHKKGFRLREIPIHYRPREAGKSKLGYMKQGPEYLKVIIKAL